MSIARSTIVVSGLTFTCYVIGFLVQVVFARVFGAEAEADAWFAAVAVPNFFTAMLFASLTKAFLPVFVERVAQSPAGAVRELSGLVNLTLIVLLPGAALLHAFADPVARALFPSFDPERFALARHLLGVSVWAVPPVATSLLLSAALQGNRRFGWAAASTLLQPIGVLAALLLFHERLGIDSMAFGLVAGCWAQLLALSPSLFRRGRYRLTLGLSTEGVRRVLKLLPPLLLSAALIASYPLLEKRFASRLAEGAISWLDYARKPLNLLIFLLAGPLSLTSYTLFAETAARGDLRTLRGQVWRTAAVAFLVLLPAVLFAAFMGDDLIGLIYERGEFTAADTAAAATALRLLVPLTLFAGTGKVLVHAFLARGRIRPVLLTAAAGVLLYVALGPAVTGRFGYRGLAVLYSSSLGLTLVLVVAVLLGDLGLPRGERLPSSLGGILLAGALMAGTLGFTGRLVPGVEASLLTRLLVLGVVGAAATGVYAGALALTRNPHLATLLRSIFRRG